MAYEFRNCLEDSGQFIDSDEMHRKKENGRKKIIPSIWKNKKAIK